MASDWIALRINLSDDPAVITIAAAVGLDEYGVVGRLHKLWSWADQHTVDGNAASVSTAWVDRFLSTPGFAAAMQKAGWLQVRSGGLLFPNFNRWNTQSAKSRLQTAKRVAAHRSNARGNGSCNAESVTDALPTRQDKTRQEDPPNPPPGGGGSAKKTKRKSKPPPDPRFAQFWQAYPNKVAKDAAAAAFAKLDPSPELLAEMLAALARQKEWPKWTKDGGEYIPHPTTWLNQRRWEDSPPEVVKPPPAPPPTRPSVIYDVLPVPPAVPHDVDFTPAIRTKVPDAPDPQPADW